MTSDREFDRLIAEELTDLSLTDQEVAEVTPWKTALERIVWGLGLTTLKLKFFGLDLLLPAIGVVMLWLGFRTLRKENGYFTLCWLISLWQVGREFASLVLMATPLYAREQTMTWQWIFLVVPFVQYVSLWLGIKTVRRKADQPTAAGAAAALAVWYVVLCAMGIVGVRDWLFVLPLVAAYVAILRNLSKLSVLLDGAGYQVRAAPVRVGDRTVWVAWFAALAVGVAAAVLLSRPSMDWTPRPENEQAGLEDIRTNLEELGVPVGILDDLSTEELAKYEGAEWAAYERRRDYSSDVESGSLKLDAIMVRRRDGSWRVLHHFEWIKGPTTRSEMAMEFWPVDHGMDEEYLAHMGEVSDWQGRLLYNQEITSYTAPYHSLEEEAHVHVEQFFGSSESRTYSVVARFTPPLFGGHLRGYVAYDVTPFDEDWWNVVDSYCNYLYPKRLVNYPYVDLVASWKGASILNSRVDPEQHQILIHMEEVGI